MGKMDHSAVCDWWLLSCSSLPLNMTLKSQLALKKRLLKEGDFVASSFKRAEAMVIQTIKHARLPVRI